MRRQILISFGIFLLLIIGTIFVVIYGKGYQIDFTRGKPEITGTGLLAVSSTPDGAQVFINGHLTTATHNTLNLPPGKYDVKIFKDGYLPWEKKIVVQKEVVSTADAFLIPTAPKLESITSVGVTSPVVDPAFTKLAYTVASQSAQGADRQNGIYVLNMQTSPILPLQSASTQIVDNTIDPLFSTAQISWSPDGKNIIATTSAGTTYQLDSTKFNSTPKDITETLASVQDQWNKLKEQQQQAQIAGLKSNLQKIIIDNFNIIDWSPDETKILYVASTSATLPQVIVPPIIGTNSTPEERTLTDGATYVYDTKEDRNYIILSSDQTAQAHAIMWIPDNAHLLYVHDKRVDFMEYDAQNETTVYAGPFVDSFGIPWPTGDKFVILTNLGNTTNLPNLYTVSLK